MTMAPAGLSKQEWSRIVDCFEGKMRTRVMNDEGGYRHFIEGILWVVSNNRYWTDLPQAYGPWRTSYIRFGRWLELGYWSLVIDCMRKNSSTAAALSARCEEQRVKKKRSTTAECLPRYRAASRGGR